MTEPAFQPPILSYEKINTYAESFLRNFSVDDELPVPIEKIIDRKLLKNKLHSLPWVRERVN